MNKPLLLIYAISWNENRNLLFSHYLSNYFEVVIVTFLNNNKPLPETIKPAKIISTNFYFRKKVGLSFSLKFSKYLKCYKPNFVLTIETHSLSSYQSIKLSKKNKFKSVVFSWQNIDSIPKYFFQKYIQKIVLSNSFYLLAGTQDVKNYLIKKGADQKKIFINPESGYDERIFENKYNDLRVDWGFTSDNILILYAGRLVKQKGINTLLNAAKKIEFSNPEFKFIFVGKGNAENKIKLSILSNVYYKGVYDFVEMGEVVRTCNIFVYPSISTKYWVEQFGYSVIEAQVAGKPVIVTKSGNLPKFVIDGINGSIIEEGDEISLIEKIFLWNKKLQINENVVNPFITKFSSNNIALNYKKILINNDDSLLENWF